MVAVDDGEAGSRLRYGRENQLIQPSVRKVPFEYLEISLKAYFAFPDVILVALNGGVFISR